MVELAREREALARAQRELLVGLRDFGPDDPWWREHLVDPISPELLAYLQAAMTRTLAARFAVYFPNFARHAQLGPEALIDRVRVAVVCAPPKRGLDAFFAAGLELCEGFDEPGAWRDLLRLERANYLARVETPLRRAELVAALRDAQPPSYDERGVDDRGPFGFVRLETNMVDLWLVPERSPNQAVRWGPEREVMSYWSLARHGFRLVEVKSMRELCISLAVQG